MDFKLIYLARRNSALAAEEFPAAWRAHSRLATTFGASLGSHFRSVKQCVKVHDVDVPPAWLNTYDGAALLAMKSWDHLLAARRHPRALKEMKDDEARVFADYVDNWTLAAEELVLREAPGANQVLLAFITPREGIGDAAFSAACDAGVEALLAVTEAGLTVNRVVTPAAAYPFRAVIELWFASSDDALAAARDERITRALKLSEVADPAAGALLVARINLDKKMTATASGAAQWQERVA